MVVEAEVGVVPFELEMEGGRQASDLGGLKSWKRQGRDSPLNLGLGQWGWSGLLCHTERF